MSARIALIREAECIGCTKCIQACPVDAIVGAAQLMHTVISDHCIGCDLCLPACPVDCIDMLDTQQTFTAEQKQARAQLAKQRFQKRKQRLETIAEQKEAERKKRLAAFNSAPDAGDKLQQILSRAAKARSGQTDRQRVEYSINKLNEKLRFMEEELTIAKANGDPTDELERRISTWKQKVIDAREDLKKYR